MGNIKKNNNQDNFIFFSKIFLSKRIYTADSGALNNMGTRKTAVLGMYVARMAFPVRLRVNYCAVFFSPGNTIHLFLSDSPP
jgi:hypothetical protein